MSKKIKNSIIIPAFNESKNLIILVPEIIGIMEKLKEGYEIIAVNDGSSDDSADVLNELDKKYQFLKHLNLKNNSGQSVALFEGIKMGAGDTIISMDADMQNDPADIPKMLESFKDVDMVCGIRKKRKDSFAKKVSTKIANNIRKKVLKSDIIDSACGFKIFKKECVEKIKFFNGIHRFLPDLFLAKDYSVIQIEINHRSRKYGKSKYGVRNRMFKALKDLIAVKRRYF